jgi:hypothetical protein
MFERPGPAAADLVDLAEWAEGTPQAARPADRVPGPTSSPPGLASPPTARLDRLLTTERVEAAMQPTNAGRAGRASYSSSGTARRIADRVGVPQPPMLVPPRVAFVDPPPAVVPGTRAGEGHAPAAPAAPESAAAVSPFPAADSGRRPTPVASPARGRGPGPAERVVRINIGRLEVKSAGAGAERGRERTRPPSRPAPALSLDAYLTRTDGRR